MRSRPASYRLRAFAALFLGSAVFSTLAFAHRASTAFRPCSLSSFLLSFFARAFPPNLPSETAPAFFLVAITPLYLIRSGTQRKIAAKPRGRTKVLLLFAGSTISLYIYVAVGI